MTNAGQRDAQLERYTGLRDGGLNRYDAAAQLGITGGAADRYERQYRERRHLPPRRRLIPEQLPRRL